MSHLGGRECLQVGIKVITDTEWPKGRQTMIDFVNCSLKHFPTSTDITALTGHMAAAVWTVFLCSLVARCGVGKHFAIRT